MTQADIVFAPKLMTLQSATAAIASSLNPQHVLQTVAKEMANLLGVKACACFGWNQETETASLLASHNTNGRRNGAALLERHDLADHQITKQALRARYPQQLWASQPDLDPDVLAYLTEAEGDTLLVLPMVCQDRVVGLVEILDHTERTFTEQEMSLAQLLANQAASAIVNAQLYDEVRLRVEELTTLNEIGQAITSTLDLQEILTIITDHVVRLLDAEAASVALDDGDSGELCFVAASGKAADFVRGKRLGLSQGITGWAIQQGEPVLVADAAEDPRFFSGFDKESGFHTRSVLCVPLKTKGQTIGVIEAMNKRCGPFDANDVRLLTSLAAPAAAAIDNARLYQQAQQEIDHRQRAEAALEEERASLAQRVAERTAELRQANAELATAARLKDRFISNVSHELRTPLSVITLLSGNLDLHYARWDEDKRQQTIRDLREQARLLNALIGSVLEISRIDNQSISTERQVVNLAQLAREEAAKQSPLARKKSQTLRVTGLEHLSISADDSQLRQVICNLLNNAIKYTPNGGRITCECLTQAPDGDPATGWPGGVDLPAHRWATLRVTDTGIGISQEHLPHLFERFYRVNPQSDIPGVGLGLSIAKELVEGHGGQIVVASTLGKGSTFTAYFPLMTEE